MRILSCVLLFVALAFAQVSQADDYRLSYQFTFLPEQEAVDVHISIPSRRWLKRAEFDFDGYDLSRFEYSGKLEREHHKAVWHPPSKDAFLAYRVKVNHQRASGAYDAFIAPQWALLRGEDLIPPVKIAKIKGAEVDVSMKFELPKNWSSVNTGWPRKHERSFSIHNPEYTFSRPAGWIVAGQLGTRHEYREKTQISVSAPEGHHFRQMELLAFVNMIWPHLAQAIDIDTPKVLITGAGKPMWRGGLSGPNSLYIHSDRPLVSENGTSTIIHELFHVVGDIHSSKNSDWITEGLAEFYSIDVLFRAGGLTEARRKHVFDGLSEWSKDIKSLSGKQSSGEKTARAAVLFDQLNTEILVASNHRYCLDHLVRRLQRRADLKPEDIAAAYKELTGKESRVLQTKLVRDEVK